MKTPDIVLDTNVIVAALRSKKGASNRLLSLVGTGNFEIHDSVSLILEYQDVLQRYRAELGLSQDDVADFIDSLSLLYGASPQDLFPVATCFARCER